MIEHRNKHIMNPPIMNPGIVIPLPGPPIPVTEEMRQYSDAVTDVNKAAFFRYVRNYWLFHDPKPPDYSRFREMGREMAEDMERRFFEKLTGEAAAEDRVVVGPEFCHFKPGTIKFVSVKRLKGSPGHYVWRFVYQPKPRRKRDLRPKPGIPVENLKGTLAADEID